MPYKDKETKRIYLLEWRKEQRRQYRLLVPRKTTKIIRTDEEQLVENARIREYQKLYKREWVTRHKSATLFYAAQGRARKSGLEFNITQEDILIPEICPILKVPFSKHNGPSLDRVDNTKGYIKGNIEVISWMANRMKSDASPEELIQFSKTMLERYDNSLL